MGKHFDFGYGFKNNPLKKIKKMPYVEKRNLRDKLFTPLLFLVFILMLAPFASLFLSIFFSSL